MVGDRVAAERLLQNGLLPCKWHRHPLRTSDLGAQRNGLAKGWRGARLEACGHGGGGGASGASPTHRSQRGWPSAGRSHPRLRSTLGCARGRAPCGRSPWSARQGPEPKPGARPERTACFTWALSEAAPVPSSAGGRAPGGRQGGAPAKTNRREGWNEPCTAPAVRCVPACGQAAGC